MLLVVFLAFQTGALAHNISGKVSAVDLANAKLTVTYSDPNGKEVQEDITAAIGTEFLGFASLEELKIGDDVTIQMIEGAAGEPETVASITKEPSIDALTEEIDQAKLETAKEEARDVTAR